MHYVNCFKAFFLIVYFVDLWYNEIYLYRGRYIFVDEKSIISLENPNISVAKQKKHTPSTIQADTLFTFTRKLEFLIPYIKNRIIPPRYCVEDISYLKIRKLKKIAFPMKCFCDINMHRLDVHLGWYGYYGLAFSKEWGMNRGIQPIQYINQHSELCKDFSKAFSAALSAPIAKKNSPQEKMKNFLLHELMYYKPYDGKMENRNTGKIEKKCFTDECEWRFIPDVTVAGFEQAFHGDMILNAGVLEEISNSMSNISEISLPFEYDDLKYIIVKTRADFEKLTCEISDLADDIQHELISKVVIWDVSRRDF